MPLGFAGTYNEGGASSSNSAADFDSRLRETELHCEAVSSETADPAMAARGLDAAIRVLASQSSRDFERSLAAILAERQSGHSARGPDPPARAARCRATRNPSSRASRFLATRGTTRGDAS